MSKIRIQALLLSATATLVLAACGGGGGGGVRAEDQSAPPASAGASSQGFLAYIAGLANGMWDSAEPRDLSNFNPPSENTDAQEPVGLVGDAS